MDAIVRVVAFGNFAMIPRTKSRLGLVVDRHFFGVLTMGATATLDARAGAA